MTKREREALREYVDAVCQFSESQVEGATTVMTAGPVVQTAAEWRHDSAQRLNAADDRLRALGMLP